MDRGPRVGHAVWTTRKGSSYFWHAVWCRASLERQAIQPQPCPRSPPPTVAAAALKVMKQQRQAVVAVQQWAAAACNSLSQDSSFLEPRLAIRAPRPR